MAIDKRGTNKFSRICSCDSCVDEAQNEDAKQTLPSPAALIVRAPNCHADQNETHHNRHGDDDKPATKFHKNKWNCVYPCKTKSDYIILYRSILAMLGHNIDQPQFQKRGFCSSWKLYNIFFAVTKHSYLTYSYHVSICILSITHHTAWKQQWFWTACIPPWLLVPLWTKSRRTGH